eukprot:6289804-Amphidinium_carterae.4
MPSEYATRLALSSRKGRSPLRKTDGLKVRPRSPMSLSSAASTTLLCVTRCPFPAPDRRITGLCPSESASQSRASPLAAAECDGGLLQRLSCTALLSSVSSRKCCTASLSLSELRGSVSKLVS